MTDKVMKEAHDTPLSIHPGSTKMYLDIRQKSWWSKMKQDIARYIEECDVCRRVKAEHQKPAGLLQPLPIPEWTLSYLIVQYAAPDILDISIAHQGLNAQFRFGFKQNLELRLFIERTIIAAVIKIDAHLF